MNYELKYQMKVSLLFLPLFFSFVLSTQLAAYLDYNAETESIKYSILLSVGTPHNRLKLTIDYDYSGITIFKRLDETSITWSNDKSGSDVVTFGDEKYHVAITLDPNRALSQSENACPSCEGIIGFGEASFIWTVWSQISFTPSTIIFGKRSKALEITKHDCNACIAPCIPSINGGLCSTKAYLNGIKYNAIFSSGTYTYFPEEIYEGYIFGKNIYGDAVDDWEPINISFPNIGTYSNSLITYYSDRGGDITNCPISVNIKLRGDDLVIDSDKSHKKLLIKSHDLNDTIIFGLSILSHVILHYENGLNVILIKAHETYQHHSPFNLFAIGFLLWLVVRWDLQDISFKAKDDAVMSLIFDVPNEIIGIPFVFALFAIKKTTGIMKDYKLFYIATGIVISIEALIILIVVFATIHRTRRYEPYTGFKYNFIKRSLNCLFLSTGIWLAMIERRTDSLGNLITFIIQGVIAYYWVYYISMGIIYFYYRKKVLNDKIFASYCLIFLPLSGVYYIPTGIIYFVAPVCRYYASQIMEELYIGFALMFYMIVVLSAIYIAELDIGFAIIKKKEKKVV
jgi:hypothetical protein